MQPHADTSHPRQLFNFAGLRSLPLSPSLCLSLTPSHKWYIKMWIQLLANNFQILPLIWCPVPGSFLGSCSVTATNLIMRISIPVKRRSAYNLTRSHSLLHSPPPPKYNRFGHSHSPLQLIPLTDRPFGQLIILLCISISAIAICHLRFAICNFDFDLCDDFAHCALWFSALSIRPVDSARSVLDCQTFRGAFRARSARALRKQKLPKTADGQRQMENGQRGEGSGVSKGWGCKSEWNWKAGRHKKNIWKTTRFELRFLSNVLHNLLWNYRANEVRALRFKQDDEGKEGAMRLSGSGSGSDYEPIYAGARDLAAP